MRALVTGFGPFLDNAVNPSDALARALDGRRALGVSLRARSPLPVELGRAARLALDAARSVDADAVVALGLAAGAPRIRVERVGRNRCSSDAPDAAGVLGRGRSVLPGAPATLACTLDPAPIHEALRAAGIASDVSYDAGGYVCNDLLYRLLAAGERALFVHVPEDVDVRKVAQPLALGIARSVIASAGHDAR